MNNLLRKTDSPECTCEAVMNEVTGERIPHTHVIFEDKDVRDEWLDSQHVSV